MGIAAYNRGSRAIRRRLDLEQEAKLRFWATYEIVRPGTAIVELTYYPTREWAGGGRVEIRSKDFDALYEECYRHAAARAADKGGVLDRFAREATRAPW